MFCPAFAGLQTAVDHTGSIRRVLEGGGSDAENATQLFGARFGSDQCAGSDRTKRV